MTNELHTYTLDTASIFKYQILKESQSISYSAQLNGRKLLSGAFCVECNVSAKLNGAHYLLAQVKRSSIRPNYTSFKSCNTTTKAK